MATISVLFCLKGHNNMESGLSPQDKKDLDKFIKFFALKVRLFLFPMSEEVCKNFHQCCHSLLSDL